MNDLAIRDQTANPAPIGLLGFGVTTVMLNFHNAGLFGMNSAIIALGIFYGGLAQLIAGIMEWKKGNSFAATAFVSYGVFWLSLVGLLWLPKTSLGIPGPDAGGMAVFLGIWGLFTLVMFFGTLHLSRALQVVFGSLVVLFFLLAAGEVTGNAAVTQLAGWEGLFCGASAIYAGLAQVLNEVSGRAMLPLGVVAR